MPAVWRPIEGAKPSDIAKTMNQNGQAMVSDLRRLTPRKDAALLASLNPPTDTVFRLDVGSQASLYELPTGSRTITALTNGIAGQLVHVYVLTGTITLTASASLRLHVGSSFAGPTILRFMCLDGTEWISF